MESFCHQCGDRLHNNAKFCSGCGTAVSPNELASSTSNVIPHLTEPVSPETSLSETAWPDLGMTTGKYNLIPYLSIFFQNESEFVKRSWGEGTIDMTITDGGILFSPSTDKSNLKKALLGVERYAGVAGLGLGFGAGGTLVTGTLGAGIALGAGLASRFKASSNSSDVNELHERFLSGQAIFCRRGDIKVIVFSVKKSFLKSEARIFIEGSVEFPSVGPRNVAIEVPHNQLNNLSSIIYSTGYAKESDIRPCSEIDVVSYISKRYTYPPMTTYAERIDRLKVVMKEMELERQNKHT